MSMDIIARGMAKAAESKAEQLSADICRTGIKVLEQAN